MGKFDKKPVFPWGAKSAPREAQTTPQEPETTPREQLQNPPNTLKPAASAAPKDNPELQEIAQWLSTVKFRQKAVGGLDPADVWKKIEELNGMYEKALAAERMRCNLLLRQFRRAARSAPPEASDGKK